MPAYPAVVGLPSGSCSSGPRFASGFLQIPPRDGHPCPRLSGSALPPPVRDSHSRSRACLAHIGAARGGLANLWTEYIKTPEHAEYLLFPRRLVLNLPGLLDLLGNPGALTTRGLPYGGNPSGPVQRHAQSRIYLTHRPLRCKIDGGWIGIHEEIAQVGQFTVAGRGFIPDPPPGRRDFFAPSIAGPTV